MTPSHRPFTWLLKLPFVTVIEHAVHRETSSSPKHSAFLFFFALLFLVSCCASAAGTDTRSVHHERACLKSATEKTPTLGPLRPSIDF